jgi:hypothetical protein
VKCKVVSQVAVAASVLFICNRVGKSNSSLAFTFARNKRTFLVSGPWHANLLDIGKQIKWGGYRTVSATCEIEEDAGV